jgi:RimJ/RimL family protein N-acetyltransferase
MCGLENISWENRNAEISIIMDPACQGNEHGSQAVELLLNQGFDYLNLENIFGECYLSNPAVKFWEKNIEKYSGTKTILPNRKYWEGEYWDSLYFNFNKSDYKER